MRLRPVEPDDLSIFFENQADPGAAAMADVPSRDRLAFDAHWARTLTDPTVLIRTIDVDGIVAGHVVSFIHDGRRVVGYWIGRDHWGKGYASEALAQFLATELPERPIEADVHPANKASIRVLEKAGFQVYAREETGIRLRLDP